MELFSAIRFWRSQAPIGWSVAASAETLTAPAGALHALWSAGVVT
jgi:hypothetical protein